MQNRNGGSSEGDPDKRGSLGDRIRQTLANPVFTVAAIFSVAMAAWGILSGDTLSIAANSALSWMSANFDWLFLYGVTFFVFFSIVLAISKLGRIKLGADDDKPAFSTVSWFAMLFASGMGVGLVFWGVAEPLSHFVSPIGGIEAMSDEAQRFSIRTSIMHWGLHPWACYAVVAIALGYFQFRRKKPALLNYTLEPIIGKVATGILGKIINIYVVILTAVGVTASFGMGCLQLSGGLEYLFGIESNWPVWLVMMAVVCAVYTLSSVSGVAKGMKKLSDINVILCSALMVVAFLVGSQVEIIYNLFVGIGDYLTNFIQDSVRRSVDGDSSWIQAWRVFYWAWWLSWSPFVGLFLARVSRGRTIRQFVAVAMIAPTLFSCLWFAINGTLAIDFAQGLDLETAASIAAVSETAIYSVFASYPLGVVMSAIAMVLLFLFFITSADSATYVLSMTTSEGNLDPPNGKKVFWGVAIAAMAFALILSGGVSMVQTMTIVISFPFIFIMLLMCVSLVKMLIADSKGKLSVPEETQVEEQSSQPDT